MLESLTHSSFTDTFKLGFSYEKLEFLGDAILDYIANSNLIEFTMFEKYNVKERMTKEYFTKEEFQPSDAHKAKSLLTKNSFLAKIMCLLDLHQYILISKHHLKDGMDLDFLNKGQDHKGEREFTNSKT